MRRVSGSGLPAARWIDATCAIRRRLTVLLACALAASARADDADRLTDLENRLDESLQLIRQLTERVRELEAREGNGQAMAESAPASASAGGDVAGQNAALEHEIAEIAAAQTPHDAQAATLLHGFADVGAGTHNPITPDLKGAFVGSLDLYLTPRFGDRTSGLFELNFEVGEEGELEVDLERAQMGYQFANAGTVWIGRFHTPYGYYNAAFHHGQQISTSLRRPRFIAFEDQGGIMPAHTVGSWFTGGERIESGRVTYDLYVGNAQTIQDGVLDMGAAGIEDANVIFGGNLGFLPDGALEGLKIGVSAFTDEVDDDLMPGDRTRVNTYGLYFAYDADRWEHIAELYVFDDEDLSGSGGSHRSEAGFVQLAYRTGRLTPYARYERADLDQDDHFFSAQGAGVSYHREALGLRFDLALSAALKLELATTHTSDRAREPYEEALMQYAIRF